jgi:uncharacterized protein
MNLADRLRAVVRPGDSAALNTRTAPTDTAGATDALANREHADRAAEVLGGEWRDPRARSAAGGPAADIGLSDRVGTGPRYLVIDRQYPAAHCLGHVAVADSLPGPDGLWPRARLLMSGDTGTVAMPGRLMFFDLETTGLGGGAGTYAFLVGCGWFEGATFRIRQFFLSSYAAERGLLEEVADTMAAFGTLVTYNGKSFDVPLIDTRFLFHRLTASHGALPHLDMLHPARRLWRPSSAPQSSPGTGDRPTTVSCGLAHVEQAVLGHVRQGDVPGFEIPSRYFHYVRTGDTRPLESVLEHNRLDLLALVVLTATAARLLEAGAAGARTAREALGLGQLFERAGMLAEARACYTRAAGADPAVAPCIDVDPPTCAEALRAYGVLCRRDRQYEQAADAWRRVLALPQCPTHIAQQASEALAVHHEHRVRDLSAARHFARQALTFDVSTTRVRAGHHRLARIDRKLGVPPSPPLF